MLKVLLIGMVMGSIATPVVGDGRDSMQIQSLRAEIETLKSEIAQLQESKHDMWLSERQAEEFKGLVWEVLSDAETRATLLQDGMLGGHDGKHFFLKSADRNFLMKIGGQIQIRAVREFQNDRTETIVTDAPGVELDGTIDPGSSCSVNDEVD